MVVNVHKNNNNNNTKKTIAILHCNLVVQYTQYSACFECVSSLFYFFVTEKLKLSCVATNDNNYNDDDNNKFND